jgi:hypothetical protein
MSDNKDVKEKLVEAVVIPPQSSIKLTKYAKGYGWEIKIYCDDLTKCVDDVKALDKKMRDNFADSE